MSRRTTCYKLTKGPAKVNSKLVEPIKEIIEAEPSFGYRTVAALLDMIKSTAQLISQLRAGGCGSARLNSVRESKRRFLALKDQINDELRICAGSGEARTTGSVWC